MVHRHETDQQLIDEVVNSEVLLRHLNARNVAMEADMEVCNLLCVFLFSVGAIDHSALVLSMGL